MSCRCVSRHFGGVMVNDFSLGGSRFGGCQDNSTFGDAKINVKSVGVK